MSDCGPGRARCGVQLDADLVNAERAGDLAPAARAGEEVEREAVHAARPILLMAASSLAMTPDSNRDGRQTA